MQHVFKVYPTTKRKAPLCGLSELETKMNSSLALIFLVLQILFIGMHAAEESISLLPETTVTTINKLAGPVLNVHCRSKDDDLGVHIIEFERSYSFTFRPHVWGTTQFSCSFQWVQGEIHNFSIYKFHRCKSLHWLQVEKLSRWPLLDAPKRHWKL